MQRKKRAQIKIAQQVLKCVCATPLGALAHDDSVKITARFPFVIQAFIYFILETVLLFCVCFFLCLFLVDISLSASNISAEDFKNGFLAKNGTILLNTNIP